MLVLPIVLLAASSTPDALPTTPRSSDPVVPLALAYAVPLSIGAAGTVLTYTVDSKFFGVAVIGAVGALAAPAVVHVVEARPVRMVGMLTLGFATAVGGAALGLLACGDCDGKPAAFVTGALAGETLTAAADVGDMIWRRQTVGGWDVRVNLRARRITLLLAY